MSESANQGHDIASKLQHAFTNLRAVVSVKCGQVQVVGKVGVDGGVGVTKVSGVLLGLSVS